MTPMLKLYSYFRSTSAWRVRIALNLKKLRYELVPVHLVRNGGEHRAPAFREQNPLMQVPVLEIGTDSQPFVLTQSVAIIEYLDEVFPVPALYPKEPLARARVRQLVEMVNSGIQPLQNLATQNVFRAHGVDPTPITREFVSGGLAALEQVARASAGKYLVGDAVSAAEAYLIPELGFARRIELPLDAYPTLVRIEHECEGLEAFVTAHPKSQPDFEP